MSTLWFEDELQPSIEEIEAQARTKEERDATISELRKAARGIVRAHEPRWEKLGEPPLTSGKSSILWKVRLRFEFEPKTENAHFIFARCNTYLRALQPAEPLPAAYDMYPQNLFEGKPETVSLKFGPSLKIAGVEASLGEIGSEINVGEVAPIVVGFLGEDARSPYWEIKPRGHPLIGFRTFWLVLEQPEGCTGIRLSALVEGVIQTYWGPFPVYPKELAWDNRPSVVIR